MITRVLLPLVVGTFLTLLPHTGHAAVFVQSPAQKSVSVSSVATTPMGRSMVTKAGGSPIQVSTPVAPPKAPSGPRPMIVLSAAAVIAALLGWLAKKGLSYLGNKIAAAFWAAIGRGLAVKVAVELAVRGLLPGWLIDVLEAFLFF